MSEPKSIEQIIKERLALLATKITTDTTLAAEIVGLDLYRLEILLAETWQEGHDTALINGQSQNPYSQEPR